MANISISIKGIDQAIASLNYRANSVKQRTILAIRAFYTSEDVIQTLNSIDTDALVKTIWDISESLSKVKAKRKNFSTIKSSINADLGKLSKKNQNPENIIITDSNTFDMSQEAKNDLLNSFSDAVKTGDVDLNQAADLLKAVTDFLDDYQPEDTDGDPSDIVDQIKNILKKITKGVSSEESGGPGKEGKGSSDGAAEELEEKESDEGLRDIEGPDRDETFGGTDEADEDTEEIELDEDEELEEIELDEDEEIELIDDDTEIEEVEIDEDEEFEEVDAPDEEVEEVAADEDEAFEEIEIDEDEELEEVEPDEGLRDIEGPDRDETFGGTDEADEDTEEIELDEDEELEEIELDEDEEIELIDDDTEIEEVEIDEDEEFEEVDAPDEEVEEVAVDEDEEFEEIEIDENEELEEVEALDEDELKALEEYRNKKELAEHFDETLGEREKKYNKYVTVPAGEYTIGTKKSIKSSLELQQFDMPEVHIAIYPVTNALFEIFIEETGYVTTAEKKGYGRVYFPRFKKDSTQSTWNKSAGSEDIKEACWYQPFGSESTIHGKRNHPVVQVSVEDAVVFASWIGRRIPTEAEWESAARTDLGYKYPWGNEFNPDALNIEKSGLADTSSVDEYDLFGNEFKIIDMLGNIMEWTSDLEIPPIKSKKTDRYCIAKGGAWNAGDDVTIGSRALFKPNFTSNTIGFRCISEIFL